MLSIVTLTVALVAPLAGAWIETIHSASCAARAAVAPLAGAWIETTPISPESPTSSSLPSRERGLKLDQLDRLVKARPSLPSRERGLKPAHANLIGFGKRSPPQEGVDQFSLHIRQRRYP